MSSIHSQGSSSISSAMLANAAMNIGMIALPTQEPQSNQSLSLPFLTPPATPATQHLHKDVPFEYVADGKFLEVC